MNRLACLLPFFLAGCGAADDHPVSTDAPASNSGLVTGERIVNADAEPGNWLSTGRTYDEQRFSPLTDINDGNVGGLGLAWYFDI
ncbi:MAG: PQQ-dependent dehydrogenase, methanol/ethanol family, partial [Pseudomonadota bacterium]|nr:PQQ-dependent dehydrogenase, methanol/ethanol family [Pseudomonadota bacterium]